VIPADCPERLRKLVEVCWAHEPTNRPSFENILPVFDTIIIESVISDTKGREMWKKMFVKEKLLEKVPWDQFAAGFASFFGDSTRDLEDVSYKCLKALLANDNLQQVTIENFGRFLEWFGPMESPDILDRVKNLLKQEWFHGEISATEAENLLTKKDNKKGTFLVRFSSREPGSYAITVVAKEKKVKHYRIYHKPGLRYVIGTTECQSIDDIINNYKHELYIKHPCPGSRFEEIFLTKPKKPSGYIVPEFM